MITLRMVFFIFSSFFSVVTPSVCAGDNLFSDSVRSELRTQFSGAEIKIEKINAPQAAKKILDIRESGSGSAIVTYVDSENKTQTTEVSFSANKKSYVSTKRIRPGERLSAQDFEIREIDVSKGLSYQYRGMMLPLSQDLNKLEARQTILEGQYPLISSVQNMPEVRRGDQVTVYVDSNDVRLTATAIAQEPGSKNQSIRIITQKSKKELTANVLDTGLVEIKL